MKSIAFKTLILSAAIVSALTPSQSLAKQNNHKHFGKNAPFLVDDLPGGTVKSKLKKLKRAKQDKAMKWLHSINFSEHDLSHIIIDDEGAVLYGDTFDATELTDNVDSPLTEAPQPISATDTFKLHSKPGASNIIYLDFNGHTISGTAWNGSSSNIQAKAFNTDGDITNFSSAELAQIAEIWHRIAEDFAPFDTDVTTEEPGSFGPNTGRILITHNKDASGNDMPYSTAGGVAYVNVWGRSNYASYYSPALVYYNNLASFAPYIAEAASHEMGHNLGLSHDGTSSESYYKGHGNGFVSWGSIMGVGYYTNVTQWSKGEYADASLTQDDINIIINHLNLRADDHSDDIYSPSPLLVDAQGTITVTSPEFDPMNINPENKGIIETRSDVDYFAFDAGSGTIDLTVSPAWDSFYRSSRRGANLDIQATLYNWDGQIITSSDPLDETDAQITAQVSAGQYLLAVTGTGNTTTPYSDYGSLGQYFISGNVAPFTPVTDTTPPSPNPMGWSVAPYSQSRTSISMQATTASDESGSVQYKFICLNASVCSDSVWQSSNQYTATGLLAGNSYSFQVIARDQYGNETLPSAIANANTATNNSPQTQSSSVTTAEDSPLDIDLASQSSDPDADPLSFNIQSQVSHGTLVNLNNGIIRYTPNTNFNGTDSFNYTVNDNFGGSAAGTISISVTAVNDNPIAIASAPANNPSLSVAFSSAGSYDPDSGDVLTFNWNFGDGSSSNAANPNHSYASAGTYSITLTVTDNHGASNSKTISTTIVDSTIVLPESPSNLTYTANKIVSGRRRSKTISGTVDMQWNTSQFADSYNIYRCEFIVSGKGKSRSTTCNYAFYANTDTPHFQTALTAGKFRYKVNAANANGISSFSNEITVKP